MPLLRSEQQQWLLSDDHAYSMHQGESSQEPASTGERAACSSLLAQVAFGALLVDSVTRRQEERVRTAYALVIILLLLLLQ